MSAHGQHLQRETVGAHPAHQEPEACCRVGLMCWVADTGAAAGVGMVPTSRLCECPVLA
jgi:hypothetical protein